MVGPDGLEPSTPRLSSACSNQLSYEPENWQNLERATGGADRVRTGDPLLAKQVLYQLSYDPIKWSGNVLKNGTLEIYFVRSTGTRERADHSAAPFDHRPGNLRCFAVSLERR